MGFFSKIKQVFGKENKGTEESKAVEEKAEELVSEAEETVVPEAVPEMAEEVEAVPETVEEPEEEAAPEMVEELEEETVSETAEEPEEEAVPETVEEPEEAPAPKIAEEPEEAASESEEEPEPKEKKKGGFFRKLIQETFKEKFSKTASKIGSVFSGYTEINDDFYDELEEGLILADLGMDTTLKAVESLRAKVKADKLKTTEEAKGALRDVLEEMLNVGDTALNLSTKPSVILVIGVNGVGKTTTIGKLASQLKQDGKKVLLCAADTFRAAAADQLEIWSQRAGVDIIRQDEGADPAAVVFDAIAAAKARKTDVILCDTAGRLHNKANLMKELEKIARIIDRELPGAAKEVLLVLDGTTGQNGLSQAKQFKEIAGVTGMALTKLDGTAKGGIVVAVSDALQIPVKYVGVGEQIGDLMPFDARSFVEALI